MSFNARWPFYMDPARCRIGRPLTSEMALGLYNNFLYLNYWKQQGTIFSYVGVPDNDANLGGFGGTLPGRADAAPFIDGSFYPIFYSSELDSETDRNLGVKVIMWPEIADNAASVISWSDYYATGWSVFTELFNSQVGWSNWEVNQGDEAWLDSPLEFYKGVKYTPETNGGFTVCRLRMQSVCPASVSIFAAPPLAIDDDDAKISERFFKSNAIVRGVNGSDAYGFGYLREWLGYGGNNENSVERNTRRCYFNTGHPGGIWYDDTTEINLYSDGITSSEFTFKIKARNYLDKTTGNLTALPALYVREAWGGADSTGCTVKYTSARTSDTWTYTFDGAEGTGTLILPTDGGTSNLDVFDFSVDEYDEITIEVDCVEGKEIVIHTVSLWEGNQYDSQTPV